MQILRCTKEIETEKRTTLIFGSVDKKMILVKWLRIYRIFLLNMNFQVRSNQNND